MTDHPADQADSGSRRSAFAKIGAVAAGAWVAPQVLSTTAASAQSVQPCTCPVAYANATLDNDTFVFLNTSVPFDSNLVTPVGITVSLSLGQFALASAGIYRVTYSVATGWDSAFTVMLDGLPVTGSGITSSTAERLTRVVLVSTSAGQTLTIRNTGRSVPLVIGAFPNSPAASLLVELVA